MVFLHISSLELIAQTIDKEKNIICYKCGETAKRYGYAPIIRIRHLSILLINSTCTDVAKK